MAFQEPEGTSGSTIRIDFSQPVAELRSLLFATSGREVNRERRSSAGLRIHQDKAAMRFDRALHDREAKTGAADPTSRERLGIRFRSCSQLHGLRRGS